MSYSQTGINLGNSGIQNKMNFFNYRGAAPIPDIIVLYIFYSFFACPRNTTRRPSS